MKSGNYLPSWGWFGRGRGRPSIFLLVCFKRARNTRVEKMDFSFVIARNHCTRGNMVCAQALTYACGRGNMAACTRILRKLVHEKLSRLNRIRLEVCTRTCVQMCTGG